MHARSQSFAATVLLWMTQSSVRCVFAALNVPLALLAPPDDSCLTACCNGAVHARHASVCSGVFVVLQIVSNVMRATSCHKRHAQVIQLQGDQRKNVLQFLTQEGLVKKDLIKIHGF